MFRVPPAWRRPISFVAVVALACALGAQALSDGLAGHAYHGPSPALVRPAAAKRVKELNLSPWVEVAPGERQEYPDVAVDASERAWVTWQSFDNPTPQDLSERILLAPFDAHGALADPVVLEEGPGERFWPRIVAHGDHLWVTWNTRVAGHWQVHGVEVRAGVPGPINVLSNARRNALRPVLGLDGHQRPWVAWEEEREGQFVIVLRPFEGHGPPMTVTMEGELNLRPALAPGPNGGLWIAWDRYQEGVYSVWMRPVAGHRMGEPIAIAGEREGGWNLAPALSTGPDGTVWVAWHTNVEPHTGRHTISARLRIAAYRDERLWLPTFGQPPPIQASLGGQYLQVEDTVEFPNLVADAQGRLWLTARRGQGYFGMVADQDGWHGPYNLARLGWGGRGRELRMGVAPSGAIFTVARRMHQVALQVLTPPHLAARGPLELTPMADAQVIFASGSGQPGLGGDAGGAAALGERQIKRQRRQARFSAAVEADLLQPQGGRVSGRGDPSDGISMVALDRSDLDPPEPPGQHPTPEPAPRERVLLGDLHTHSWHSDGTGDPDQIFTRARDLRGLDFVALTDHDISNGNVLSPAEFAYIQLLSDLFNRPGHFATIKGYEWTSKTVGAGGSGHKNVYFPGDEAQFFGYGSGVDDTQTLFGLLKAQHAIAIPHHIGWTGTDWENHDPEVQPDVEIVSVHGAFEHPNNLPVKPRANLDGMFVQDGLALGLRFGVVGGSDGHGVAWHYGVSRKEDPWETGLTGVYADTLTRGALVEALRDRRCYASSGTPILLHFQADGVPMGGDLSPTAPPALHLRVHGSAALLRVDIIRDGQVIKSFPGGGLGLTATYREGSLEPGHHYYYARAVQGDGEVAWTSPVFVEAPQPQLEAALPLVPALQ